MMNAEGNVQLFTDARLTVRYLRILAYAASLSCFSDFSIVTVKCPQWFISTIASIVAMVPIISNESPLMLTGIDST